MSTPYRSSLVLICTLWGLALHGEELPPRAFARLGDYRFFHGSSIELVALSPDGSRVASLGTKRRPLFASADKEPDPFDRTIVVWDAVSGHRLREFQAPGTMPVGSLAFTPDSKRLLVICDKIFTGERFPNRQIVFFDLDSGKIVDQSGPIESNVKFLNFSTDGKRLLMGEGHDAVISLDIASWKTDRKWQAPAPKSEWLNEKERVSGGVPSPDGKFMTWHAYPLDERDLPASLRNLIPRRNVVIVSDAVTNKILYRKVVGYNYDLKEFTFSPDSRWFMIGHDKTCIAWETATGKELFRLAEPSASWVALSPDGRWALTGGWPCRLWNLETKKPARDLLPGRGYVEDGTRGQLFSADGKMVVLWTDSTLRVFDTATGKEHARTGHRAPHILVRFSADGRTLFSTCEETRCTWDLSPGKKTALLTEVQRNPWERGRGNSRFIVASVNEDVCLRDTSTGRVLHELEKLGSHPYWESRFSPDASRLALRRELWEKITDKNGESKFRQSDDSPVVRLYDTGSGKKSGEIKLKHELSYDAPIFSPDGRTIAWLDRANDVHLHDAVTGKLVRTLQSVSSLPANECRHGDLIFSPDGQHVIVTTFYVEEEKRKALPTRVFDVANGKEIRRFYVNPDRTKKAALFSCTACSPDNRLLAVAEEESGTIRLIEIESGNIRAEFKGHREGVHDLAFSPDSKTLASGGEDNVVYLWDVIGPGVNLNGKTVSDADLDKWFTDLADAKRGDVIIASFIHSRDQSVKALSARLRPVEPLNEKRVSRLIADLDSDSFADRESASNALSRFGDRVQDTLRSELKKMPSPEAHRRIQDLLDKFEVSKLPLGNIQTLRAIEVLERIGTPEAVLSLERMAVGAPEAWETRAAQAAVSRLVKRKQLE